jgi:anaerobic selenocysteine-containing dehydrogenase
MGAAAPLWAAAKTCARGMPRAVRRAMGDAPGIPESALADRLFDIIISAPQGATFSVHTYEEVWSLVEYPDRKIRLAIPSLLEWLATLAPSVAAPVDYPFMLAAGQRRMYNANQIFRDPAWRRSDPDGALLVNPQDLASLDASDGDWVAVQSKSGRLVVRSHADDTMRRGQLSLPHGYGQSYPAPVGRGRFTNGPRINVLTSGDHRDPIAGTPYHKNVPVRLERATPHEARAAEANSRGINAVPATASATEPGG